MYGATFLIGGKFFKYAVMDVYAVIINIYNVLSRVLVFNVMIICYIWKEVFVTCVLYDVTEDEK